MVELLALVCTLMGSCKDVSYTYDAQSIGMLGCMLGAQQQLAKWTETHPGWQVKKWSCGKAGRFARA